MLRLLPYSAGGANFDFRHSVFLSFQKTLYVYVQIARSSPVHGLMFIECFFGIRAFMHINLFNLFLMDVGAII